MEGKFVLAIRQGSRYEVDTNRLSCEEILTISNLLVDRLNEGGFLGLNEEIMSKYPKIGPGGQLIARRHTYRRYGEEAIDVNGDDVKLIISLKENELEIETTPQEIDVLLELRLIETLVYEKYQIQRLKLKEEVVVNSDIFTDFASGVQTKDSQH